MKNFRCLYNNKGFTLVEILIVIVIIGILVGIAVPIYSDVAENSRRTVCKYNASYLSRIIAMNLFNYEKEDRFDSYNSSGIGLNNYIFGELDNNRDNDNRDQIRNPASRSKVILHSNSPVSGTISDGRNPAVFMTGNDSYSYSGGGATDNLEGTIVIYFNESSPYQIQIYYLDKKGNKVELLLSYH